MTTNESTTSPRILEGVAIVVFAILAGLLAWLWHDTQIRDQAIIQSVATAKQSQTSVDKQATTDIVQANKDLQKQNTDLQQALDKAKTTAQQITLINQQLGTHLQTQTQSSDLTIQALNPSVSLSSNDVQSITKEVVSCKEDENQLAADKIALEAKDQQIQARDTTITDEGKEITALKGGSHWHRFWKAAEHVGIGVGLGIIVSEAVKKK